MVWLEFGEMAAAYAVVLFLMYLLLKRMMRT
jgi:hypothetical protein